MASSGQVTLRGAYPPGTAVRLVQVKDETVLRAEGGREVDVKKVDKDGSVTFRSGVEVGARYFAVGQIDGAHVERRLTGRSREEDGVTFQAPVVPDRQRLSDGSWLDERPERVKAPHGGVGPAPGLHQVPDGTLLRSDTGRGYAHPVEAGEPAPYPGQDEVSKGTVQRSDTEHGQATPVAHDAPSSQSDVGKGTVQRSATPMGYATPIPSGDAVDAQLRREAAETKASVGSPQHAAAHPPGEVLKTKDGDRDPAAVGPAPYVVPAEEVRDSRGEPVESGDGLDAQGQPADEGVAAAAGVEPASKPAEPVRQSKRSSKR